MLGETPVLWGLTKKKRRMTEFITFTTISPKIYNYNKWKSDELNLIFSQMSVPNNSGNIWLQIYNFSWTSPNTAHDIHYTVFGTFWSSLKYFLSNLVMYLTLIV